MSSLLDPSAAKEFLRRATALGFNSAAMAAAAAGGTPPSHKPSGGGGNGGGSDRGDRNLDHSAGSPHANDPSGLRRPRSVYNSSQVNSSSPRIKSRGQLPLFLVNCTSDDFRWRNLKLISGLMNTSTASESGACPRSPASLSTRSRCGFKTGGKKRSEKRPK